MYIVFFVSRVLFWLAFCFGVGTLGEGFSFGVLFFD